MKARLVESFNNEKVKPIRIKESKSTSKSKIGKNYRAYLNNYGALTNIAFGLNMAIVDKKYSHLIDNTGTKQQAIVIDYIISESEPTAESVAKNLNQSGITYRDWTPQKSPDKNTIILRTEDYNGNEKILTIKLK